MDGDGGVAAAGQPGIRPQGLPAGGPQTVNQAKAKKDAATSLMDLLLDSSENAEENMPEEDAHTRAKNEVLT